MTDSAVVPVRRIPTAVVVTAIISATLITAGLVALYMWQVSHGRDGQSTMTLLVAILGPAITGVLSLLKINDLQSSVVQVQHQTNGAQSTLMSLVERLVDRVPPLAGEAPTGSVPLATTDPATHQPPTSSPMAPTGQPPPA